MTTPLGYLYFIIRSEDISVSDDTTIFIKIGMTKDPRSRISNYITHHIGNSPPIYYKIWQVHDEKLEETLALQHFQEQRVIKVGSTNPSEVIKATKADIEAYNPRDPQKRAIAPHTMLPAEHYVIKQDTAQRFEEHWEELRKIQEPIISKISTFLQSNEPSAHKLRAPCGTGKTHMTCEAIRLAAVDNSSLKVCILCPTRLIAEQWRGNLYRLGIHAPILTKGELQTKEGKEREDQTGHRFRIITYASCPGIHADPSWTYVFDEAHHTCGTIDDDNGITKRLVNETKTAGCKRLFLTFTPKNYTRDGANSMDDPTLYGTDISFPTMRDLVESGLMPDYRLLLTYKDPRETLEIIPTELKNSRKIVVCLQRVEDIETTRSFLEGVDKTCAKNIYSAHGSMSSEQVAENISSFENCLGRSWLLTCLVLLEGADIPCADTVVLLAPWKTETRLIQLLLRPGRWFPKKPTFNIVAVSDQDGLIENSLRVADFNVIPSKARHLRTAQPAESGERPRSLIETVCNSGHVWCVSYTEKNTIHGGLTPALSDFDNAITTSQIAAMSIGLDKAVSNDMVILRGPTHVAFALISAVRVASEELPDGRTKKRTILDVSYLPVRWEKPGQASRETREKSILLTVEQYRDCICELWNDRNDKNWICNPRFTGGFRYDTERRALIVCVLDKRGA